MLDADDYNERQLAKGNIEPEIITALVRHWQHGFDLPIDGKLGPETWADIKKSRQGTAVQLEALRIAVSELGEGETIGNNQGPYLDMIRQTDGTGQPWKGVKGATCASTVSSWLTRALAASAARYFIPFRPSRGARRLGKNMSEDNMTLYSPEPGAVGIYSRGPLGGWKGHAVLFESYDPDTDSAVVIENNKGKFPAVVSRNHYRNGTWQNGLLGIYSLG